MASSSTVSTGQVITAAQMNNVRADALTNHQPTLLVAASGAPTAQIDAADYTCDGTADDVQIQAALDALPSAGGTVELSDGTFNITTSIDLTDGDHLKLNATTIKGSIDELLSITNAFGVSITGINPDVSIIEQDGTGGQDAVVFNVSATTTETHVLMRNVKVLGNASSGDGIRFDHGGASGAWQRVLLENVYSRDHGANGLEINPTMVDFTARDCWFRNNGENGVELVTTASKEWTTVMFDKCYFMDNTEWGLLCTDGGSAAGNLVMLHHIVEGNGSGGITLDSVNGAELFGGHMEGNAGNTHIVVTGGNGIIAGHKLTTAATGIDFGSTNANYTILGNSILSLTTAAIDFGTSSGEFHCLGNIISGNADDYAGGGSAAKLYTNDLSDDATGTGFGVPDSAELVHVSGDSDPTIRINAQSANSANSGKVAFGETDAGAEQAWIKYDGSANALLLETTNVASAWTIPRTTGHLQAGNDVLLLRDVNAGLTASVTQTQGQGALTAEINEISTCANANDTVTLPSAAAGMKITVINNGAQTAQIFPASGDNLGAGVDTATTLASGSNVTYVAYDATNWEAV